MATKEPKVKATTRCDCGATVFQGPFQRGEFVGGTFVVRETVFQCRGCHKEYDQAAIAALPVRTVELPA
jgi:hypothetical protein